MLQIVAFAGPTGPAFCFFCLSSVSLGRLSLREWRPRCFSCLQFAAAPGFAHNRLTQLQQNLFVVLSVLFPLSGLQNRKEGLTRAFPFPGHTLAHFPLRGKAGLFLNLHLPRFAGFAQNCPTRLQQGGELASLVSFLYSIPKTAHRPEFEIHFFFLGCFCSGSAAKFCSSL